MRMRWLLAAAAAAALARPVCAQAKLKVYISADMEGVAGIVKRDDLPDMARFELKTSRELARFIAAKGSVTLDGVSLTVNTVQDVLLSVLIIPHTLNVMKLCAALAAGKQKKGWNYIELFYHEQGTENTAYVTPAYLDGLASQITGLNYSLWLTQSKNSSFQSQVVADEQAAAAQGFRSTPTLVIKGPKGQAQPIAGSTDYGTLEAEIKSVS